MPIYILAGKIRLPNRNGPDGIRVYKMPRIYG